jgi:DNA-binding NarL/FixJ family response regulator
MIRTLIADDHPIILTGLQSILRGTDIEVCGIAINGKEALELALSTKPDVAIFDYRMPLMNGAEVTRKICPVLPKMKVIIYTYLNYEVLLQEVLEAGAKGYLMKSDMSENLLVAINTVLKNKIYLSPSICYESLSAINCQAHQPLTPQEVVVLKLVAYGYSSKTAARELQVSPKTIDTHRAAIMRKICAGNMADMVRYAIRNKLIEP